MRGTQFLIFDEPTAYLTRQESAQLFPLIRRLQGEGVTIVYISHRMEEVFELADRVSVLRDGTHVGTRMIGETNDAELIAMMINRSHRADLSQGNDCRSARRSSRRAAFPARASRMFRCRCGRGEIVGLYGLIGAGRSEFALGLYRPPADDGGRNLLAGQAGRYPQRTRRDGSRHRAGAGKPPRPGALPQPADRPQHQPAGLRPADQAAARSTAGARSTTPTGRSRI